MVTKVLVEAKEGKYWGRMGRKVLGKHGEESTGGSMGRKVLGEEWEWGCTALIIRQVVPHA
jgi:hypothetical protein